MRDNREGEFEQNMEQLISLLKRIMKTPPDSQQMGKIYSFFKDQGVNINLCFFNFFPMSEEELDELEEICEQYFNDTDKTSDDLTSDLNQDDIDFLKRYGIKF